MKREFRNNCLNKRKELKNKDLTDKILNLKEYKESKTVFIYVSFGSEIETYNLICEALKNKTVLVPYCVDSFGKMIAVKIESTDDLKDGMYGIKEPKSPIEYEGNIDFAVVPGVAFSKEGYRVGYGKGYYDRFLKKHKTFSVGICHDELLFDKVPYDEFDVKLDMIITISECILVDKKEEIRI